MKPNLNSVDIETLRSLEPKIVELLKKPSKWKSLDVDYYPPRVERLYATLDGYRIHVHVIHHTKNVCLFHKHRWPAAFKQIKGQYMMGVTYSSTEITSEEAHLLPTLIRILVTAGSYYEMTQTDCLHFVQPTDDQSYSISIMVTKEGSLYEEATYRKEALDRTLSELPEVRIEEILSEVLSEIEKEY